MINVKNKIVFSMSMLAIVYCSQSLSVTAKTPSIAIVDLPLALEKEYIAKSQLGELEQKRASLMSEFQVAQNEMQKEVDDTRKTAMKLPEAKRLELERTLQEKYGRKTMEFQQKEQSLMTENETVLKNLQDKNMTFLESIAAKKNIDIILHKSAAAFVAKDGVLDVTDELVASVNKAYPPKKPAAPAKPNTPAKK